MTKYRVATFIALVALVAASVSLYRTNPYSQGATSAEFGGVPLEIEYATTSSAMLRGLAGREYIPEGYGMLFVFSNDSYHGIWMKDMQVPIDIFWLDAQGHVISISPYVATSTYPDVFYPSKPARYVLETRAGFANAYGIRIGTPLLLNNLSNVLE